MVPAGRAFPSDFALSLSRVPVLSRMQAVRGVKRSMHGMTAENCRSDCRKLQEVNELHSIIKEQMK